MMALLGVLLAMMLTEWNWGILLAVLGCFAVTMSLSFMHGLLITRMNMQPFIVTLCGLLFYRGLARFITKDETKGFGTVGGLDFLRYLANGNLFGIPMPFGRAFFGGAGLRAGRSDRSAVSGACSRNAVISSVNIKPLLTSSTS